MASVILESNTGECDSLFFSVTVLNAFASLYVVLSVTAECLAVCVCAVEFNRFAQVF